MARTRESIRRSKLDAFFSDENATRTQQLLAEEAAARAREEEALRREEELRARWDNVEGGSQSTEELPPPEEEGGGFWSSVGNNFRAAREGLAAGAEIGSADILGGITRALTPQGNMGAGGAVFGMSPLGQAGAASAGFEQEALADRQEQLAAAQRAEQDIAGIDWFGGQTLAKAAGGAANPQSASSLIPVIGPALAAGLSYPSAYGDLRFNGATPEQAAAGALPSAAAEFAGARIGNALNLPMKALGNTAGRAATRWAQETLKEGTGEGLTSLMQSANFAGIEATTTNPELRKYANMRAAQWGQDAWDSFVGGVLLGAGPATPQAAIQYAAEQGAYAQKEIALNARFDKDAEKRRAKLAANDFLKEPAGAIPVNPLRPDGAQTKPQFFEPEAAAPVVDPAVEAEQDDDVANIPSSSLMDEMRARGMAQETGNATTSVTPQRVVEALSAGRGQRGNNIVTEMLYRNKVQLVEDVSDIPSNAVEGAGGWYDGENVYVVANKLNEDSIIPDLLSIMSHEVKHGVDASGFVNPLGKQANDSIISQVKALAERGDAGAIDAWTKATGGINYNDDLTEEQKMEVVSYSINNAMDAQTGPIKGIVRTAMAAWRDTTRKAGVNEVKLDDLRYLTKNMLESVATSDRNLKGELPDGVDGQAMTISGGTSEAEQLRNNRTWLSADGKRKYEISDRESSVQIPEGYQDGDTIPIEDVLNHPNLFKELPNLSKVKIRFAPLSPGTGAQYSKATNIITVNSNDPGYAGGGNYVWNGRMHQYIIHEMQHAAQKVSGTTNGASPEDFLSPEGKALRQKRDDYVGAINAAQSLGSAPEDYADLQQELSQVESMVKEEEAKAVAAYERVLGEYEARRADQGIQFSEAELDTAGLGQQEVRWNNETGMTSVNGKLLRPTVKPTGMAQIVTPRDREQAETKQPISQDSWLGKAWTAVTRSFAGDENLGRQLNEIKLNASARAASLSVAAEQASHKMERAMMDAAKLAGVDRETIANRLNEVLEAANNVDDRDARKSAIAALDRQYPGTNLGTHINKMRELTWELASEMVKERARDPRPLTKKEKNTYVKILDNAERWTTRAYQSQMSGRELYAKTFMERAKDLSSDEAKNLAAALETIKSGYLSVPDKKVLNELSTAKLTELYKAWDAGNSRGLREAPNNRADLIDRLTELNITDGKKLDEKAMEIAKDLIGVNKEPGAAASMIRGMRQNRTVLEARQKIPKELRNIMGEVTDPRLRMSISAARLTQLVASTKALRNVYDQGENIWWSSEKSDKFTEQLNSPTFGALDGKYVSKDAQHMLGAYTNFNSSFDTELKDVLEKPNKGLGKAAEAIGSVVRPLGRWYKFSSVMLSASNMMLNFAGAGLTLAKNGVINPKHAVNGFIDTAALLATQKLRNASPERMAKNQELLLAGVTDSAQAQEFRSALWNRIHKALRNGNTDSDIKHMWNRLGDIKDSGKDLIGEVYAFMDVWSKTATYYSNKEFLTEYNNAEKLGWTDEQIIREAGYDTTMSTVSYNRASPLIKAIERNVPFGAAFLVYKAEAVRSVFGGLVVAKRYAELARDAKTSEGRAAASQAALKLIGGTLAATGGVIGGTLAMLDDEDEKDRLKRVLFPEWEQDKIHVFLGTDDKGKEHYASVNRVDPIGPANEPMVTFIRALEQDKGVGEATIKALDDFITTFKVYNDAGKLVGDLAAETFGDGASQYSRKTLFEKMGDGSFAQKIKDSASYGNLGANALAVAETMIPSQFAVWADPDRLAIDGNAAKALKAIGYKDVVVDPEQSLGFRAGDYNKGMRELQSKKSALLKNTPEPGVLLERIYDLQEKEKELFENLSESALSYRQFNKPPMFEGKPQNTKALRTKADAAAVLEGRKVNKDVINDVLNGSFYPTLVDDELVDKWYEAQTKQIERTDPDYKAKMDAAEDKADLLEKALRAKRSDD